MRPIGPIICLLLLLIFNAGVIAMVVIKRVSFLFYTVALMMSMPFVIIIARGSDYCLRPETLAQQAAKVTSSLKVHETKFDPKTLSDTECNICFDEYDTNSTIGILPCNHYFHSACIGEWCKGHDTCPYKCPPPTSQSFIV
jgi:hypothetical protein